MNAIAKQATAEPTDIDVFQGANVFDVQRFEQVHRVATVMAGASLIPDHLKGDKFEVTYGNCFLIANYAANWGFDPFAVAQATALVFGKIVFEGKLVRAVIRKFLNLDLHYAWFGNAGDMQRRCFVCDRPLTKVSDDERERGRPLTEEEILELMLLPDWRITKGTLQKWHTKSKGGGINDNWAKDEDKMFRERGAREWCREFSPGLMLGVYTQDEFDEVEQTSRSNRARDVTPSNRNPLLDDRQQVAMETIDAETGEVVETKSGAQPEAKAKTTSPERTASAKPADDSAGRAGPTGNGGQPTDSPSSVSSDTPHDDGGGGDAGSPPRVSADIFRDYYSALARMTGKESVEKSHKAFWPGRGKITHPADMQLAKDIYENNLLRVEGKITPEYLKREVDAWIAKVCGGQL